MAEDGDKWMVERSTDMVVEDALWRLFDELDDFFTTPPFVSRKTIRRLLSRHPCY